MELHALKLSLTEQDLNDLLRKYLPKDIEIDGIGVLRNRVHGRM